MRQIDLVANKLIKATLHEISIEYNVESSSNRYIFVLARKDVLVNIILGRTSYCDIALKSGDSFRAVESFKDTSAIKTDGVTGLSVLINPSKEDSEVDSPRINARAMVEYDAFDGALNYALEIFKDKYDGNVDFNLYPNNGSLSGRDYDSLSINHREHKDSCIIKLIDAIRALGYDIVKLSFVGEDEDDKEYLNILANFVMKDNEGCDVKMWYSARLEILSGEASWAMSDVFKMDDSVDCGRIEELTSVFEDKTIDYKAIFHAIGTHDKDTLIDTMLSIK